MGRTCTHIQQSLLGQMQVAMWLEVIRFFFSFFSSSNPIAKEGNSNIIQTVTKL